MDQFTINTSAGRADAVLLPDTMRPCEAARYTGISQSTLAKLRMRGNRPRGPRFVKLAGCVRYRRADLDAWIDQNVVGR